MGNEFGSLPGKDKFLAGLRAPILDRFVCRRPVKDAVKLGSLKLAGVILKLVLERQTFGKKRPAPGIVVPSRCADQNTRHATSAN
jgi:hypothetical protein